MSNSYIVNMSINCGDKVEIRNDLQIMMTTMTRSDTLLMLFISVLTLENPIMKSVGISLSGLTRPYSCACTKRGHGDFHRQMQ